MLKLCSNRGSVFLLCTVLVGLAAAQTKPRARDLGVPFDGTTGPLNAITDVRGVEVGHTTLISGDASSTPSSTRRISERHAAAEIEHCCSS